MTTPAVIAFILILLIPLWIQLRRDFTKGLALAVFFWVSMTTFVRIELPGSLPELTIHRLILGSVFCFWLLDKKKTKSRWHVPFLGYFVFWALANAVSLLSTEIDFVTSLKRYLDFVLETGLFYVVIASALREEEQSLRVLHAAVLGLSLVAILAIIEHYTAFNPVDRFIPGYVRDDQGVHDVNSTYQHRILLGTAMAMGLPLAFVPLWRTGGFRWSRSRIWLVVCLLAAGCYFSMSRGPWIGFGLTLLVLALGGSRRVRVSLLGVAAFVAITLIAKPGVLGTLTGFYEVTVDTDSHKGGTFLYRLELWKIAYEKISASSSRYLFGYGLGAGSEVELNWELSYRDSRHRNRRIESWDNHFAYTLFQSGMVGFAATFALFFRGIYSIYKTWRNVSLDAKDAVLCLLASALVYFFMMSNVLIFAKQLDYLFWSIVAAGGALSRQYTPATELKLQETEPYDGLPVECPEMRQVF